LTWRYLLDEGGHGVTTDILSHCVDLASWLIGPIDSVVATTETFIRERPVPVPGSGTHYSRGRPGDPRGAVTNEDYVGLLARFESGAVATFEASRALVGPESQMAFDVYGTEGALSWNLERMNELQLYMRSDGRHAGYRTVFAGDRFPYHGSFVPGQANGIGFEDLVVIEDYEFCRSVVEGRPHHPGFDDAVAYVSVQSAVLKSCESRRWERVESLRAG
jgi:predicted dehydrogenase